MDNNEEKKKMLRVDMEALPQCDKDEFIKLANNLGVTVVYAEDGIDEEVRHHLTEKGIAVVGHPLMGMGLAVHGLLDEKGMGVHAAQDQLRQAKKKVDVAMMPPMVDFDNFAKHLKKKRPVITTTPTPNPFKINITAAPAKNTPCPCGSGKKYKRCCLK